MRLNWLGQTLVISAILTLVWNVLISTYGKWTVLGWFRDLSPVDVMFLLAVGLVALMLSSGRGGPPSAPNRPKTTW